jgi:hypothetical protein
VMIIFLGSAASYRDLWRLNPAGKFIDNARATIPLVGNGHPAIFDTAVPELVFGSGWDVNRPSRLLSPLRTQPAYSEGAPSQLAVLDEHGIARRAMFSIASTTPKATSGCPWYTTTNSLLVPLAKPVSAGNWTVVVYYYTRGESRIRLSTSDLRRIDHTTGLPATRLMFMSQKHPTVKDLSQTYGYTSNEAFTHVFLDQLTKPVCVLKVEVGVPVPVPPAPPGP